MSAIIEYKISRYRNFRVLEVKGFSPIALGCPPGIVKEISKRKKILPRHYVVPIRTLVRGKCYFDFEFILYSFLFSKSLQIKPAIYCTKDQRMRLKTILNETLFGPEFLDLLRAQFRKLGRSQYFSLQDSGRFDAFLKKVAANKELFRSFDRLLKTQAGDKKIFQQVRKIFKELISKKPWLSQNNIPRLDFILTKNFLVCAQLKKEMELFSLLKGRKRGEFLEETLEFHEFDENNAILVHGEKDRRKTLRIIQTRPSQFEICVSSRKLCAVDIPQSDPLEKTGDFKSFKKPFMGITFLGVGSGFAHARKNSCMIAWTERKGIMVDSFSGIAGQIKRSGISENDILYTFLSHVHSDHDLGLIEQVLCGRRIKMISSRIIFESFLRKMEAITCMPWQIIEGFVDFIEMEPHKKIKLPGLKNSWLTFDYSLHSIPTGRFTLAYKDEDEKETVISHSGDTKYDVEKINAWFQQGWFMRKRRDHLLGFIWDADLIIHEVGGGKLHTGLKGLRTLDKTETKKVILVHQHENPPEHSPFHFASEGETRVLIKNTVSAAAENLEALQESMLLKGLPKSRVLQIFKQAKVVYFRPGNIVFSQNETGDDVFVILNGFAEIFIDGKAVAIYDKGGFFGELAVTTNDPRRRATVKAKSPLTLLKISKRIYKEFKLPLIQEGLYRLANFFDDSLHPGLIASLAFGKIFHWNKNDQIFSKTTLKKYMHTILSGTVEIFDKDLKSIGFFTSGEVVGQPDGLKKLLGSGIVLAHTDHVYTLRLSSGEMRKVFKLFPSFYGTVYQKFRKLQENSS